MVSGQLPRCWSGVFDTCRVPTQPVSCEEVTPARSCTQDQLTREAVLAEKAPRIPLPKDWSEHIKPAILHTIFLARTSIVVTRGRAAGSRRVHCRLQAKLAEAEAETSRLKEELRLKDLRMARVRPRRRPHYRALERVAILELRAARGGSRRQTAKRFLFPLSSFNRRLWPRGCSVWTKAVGVRFSSLPNR